MSIAGRILARQAKLPPAETRTVTVDRDLPITMPDGVILLADHYAPQGLGERPTVMIRSVYTDRTKGSFVAKLIAERGFHVLIVSGRGTCGSGGTLDPFASERDDGLAVLAWLKQQPWFNGVLGTTGASYLGFTQWAIADAAGPTLQAMSTQLTSSDFRSMIYPGDALSLEIFLGWAYVVHHQERPLLSYLYALVSGTRRRTAAARHLPLAEADEIALGAVAPHWREWLDHGQADDPWWTRSDHSGRVAAVTAPNHLVGGWRDFMLPALIRDYQELHRAGRKPYLTIGPWHHWDTQASLTSVREGLLWLRAQLLGDRTGLRDKPVRIHLDGAGEWLDLDSYPPPEVQPRPWHLQPGGGLATAGPPESQPDRLAYDPANPTPDPELPPRLMGIKRAHGDRVLRDRTDVLTYTSEPLAADLDAIGVPRAILHVSSDAASADFYVRICDVAPSGKATYVTDGLQRFAPVPACAEVELWPTAYRIRRGHRIRVQITAGAFPRWDRNPAAGTRLLHHDPVRPSAVVLPILE
ncbi:CocE/NonD family hydrolase [Nonomuraea basaltis]|uniref:CocE/NonD family hydrolase n=1 Tax=Nonomuraea basaltis TaxID=2495887 RepID=UPI00110C705C|nr:CocE/NonD family hydrolase [Nonomuraea basaltis]TMR99124.1 CocE/NonD family hydrolase [Nonomuraea basaltis]